MTEPNVVRKLVAGPAAVVCCLGLLACSVHQPRAAKQPRLPSASSTEAIRAVVNKYVLSVDNADTELARQVWAEDDRISFIHPMGHERGWIQIKSNVYEKAMRDLFSNRKLTPRDLSIKIYGDAAVVEFYWVFNATSRTSGQPLQTQGRETQVLQKGTGGAWRIVHVHYSGMPATNPGQGL